MISGIKKLKSQIKNLSSKVSNNKSKTFRYFETHHTKKNVVYKLKIVRKVYKRVNIITKNKKLTVEQ
jgi:hypothetical protein